MATGGVAGSNNAWVEERISSFLSGSSQIQEKVGLVTSRTRAGRALQGVGSAAIPGDLSDVRSPIRSTIAETLTPGGRGLRRPRVAAQERGYRCPEGYQFGGRYTDSKLSTCGRQLFDLPSLSRTLLQIAQSAMMRGSMFDGPAAGGRVLRGAEPSASLIQSRAANIPRVGPMSKKGRQDGIVQAIEELSQNPSITTMMIRRDGFPMQPVVSVADLRKVPDNRNMEEAAFLVAVASPDDFGKDELGLLSNTGVTSVIYVTPSGANIRLDRARPLTVGERRKLGKTVSSAEQIDIGSNPLARLEAVVSESGDAISLTKNFSAIKNPDATITSGKDRGRPRWSVEAFKGSAKRRRVTAAQVSEEAQPTPSAERGTARITSVEDAIEHINNGGNLSDIDPAILLEAAKRARVYRQRKAGPGRTLFQRTDGGVSFVQVDSSKNFEHLSAHFSAAIQDALQLPSPRVRIAGAGEKRPYLVQTPETVLPGARISRSANLADAETEDVLGLLISDVLSDVRRRNPSSITTLDTDDGLRAMSSNNAPSALVGLSPAEVARRRRLSLSEFLNGDGSLLADSLKQKSEDVRRQILAIYDELLQRARAFRIDAYFKQLRADGKLSAAEQRHMEIVKTIFEQRVDMLSRSKNSLAQFLDIQ